MTILSHFPFDSPRKLQVRALEKIESYLKTGKKFIILEAPVGSGKSPMAIAVSRYLGDAYILTPRKSLQDQYGNDFPEVRLMKGRASYPCTQNDTYSKHEKMIIKSLREGRQITPPQKWFSCSTAPCLKLTGKKKQEFIKSCHCPYDAALSFALSSNITVFNFHSFVYQAAFAGKFPKRKVLIIDEAHDTEKFLRDLLTVTFTGQEDFEEQPPKTVDNLVQYLKSYGFKIDDEEFKTKVEYIRNDKIFGTELLIDVQGRELKILPVYIGWAAHKYLFDFADVVLLMSGTIYSREKFTRPLKILDQDSMFLRLPSEFPAKNRPVKVFSDMDLSYKHWNQNKLQLFRRIENICNQHQGEKGIIHVPSYSMSQEITQHFAGRSLSDRLVTHISIDFHETLKNFMGGSDDKVLVSPSVAQGVDFSDDKGRFQIVIRPAYAPPTDPYTKMILDNGRFLDYTLDAMTVLGQQAGRVVRHKEDFGVTYLMDSRFVGIFSKLKKHIPKWFMEGVEII